MRALLIISIITLIILAILNVVLRGNKHSRLITTAIVALAAGVVLMVGVEIVNERDESALEEKEVGRHEYSQVLRWREQLPELRDEIDTAMQDERVTWAEYYAIQIEADLVPKRRLQRNTD